ncbi:MAG: hypothetical protein MUF21_04265 [Gemmatimonadaceae bacterium]|jgi:hypothetical protein|nr:hypothetical protein [Gemmatimonadaceae bacterium]
MVVTWCVRTCADALALHMTTATRRLARLTGTLMVLAASAAPLAAQATRVATGAPPARVTLALRPWPGDALRVLVEHDTEERGTLPMARGDSTVVTRTSTAVVVRSVVESVDAGGAVLRSTLDSVAVQASGGRIEGRMQRTRDALAMRGRTVMLHVATDGTVALLDRSAPAVALAALSPVLQRVPAVFPEAPVGVGDRWTRRVMVPGAPGDALVAEFVLDSLTQGGDRAWVSVRGALDDAAAPAASGDGAAGTVQGWLVLDRRRGWVVQSRLALTLRTMARRAGGAPMRFAMRMEQRMRELP